MKLYKYFLGSICAIIVGSWYMKGIEKKMIYTASTPQEYRSLFEVTAGSIRTSTEQYSTELKNEIDALCAQSSFTYTSFFKKLDELQSFSNLVIWHNVCYAVEMTHPDEAVRTAAHEAITSIGTLFVDLFTTNKRLYECAVACERMLDHTTLSPEQSFFITHMLTQWKRAGLNLEDEQFAQLCRIQKELVAISLQFESAIAQDTTVIHATHEELAGTPVEFVNSLQKTDAGVFILRLDYPTVHTIVSKCTNGALRKKVTVAFNNRAYPANKITLEKLIAKRDELAHCLGYAHFGAFDLDDQMVGSVAKAQKFLHDLLARARIKVVQEFDALKKIQDPSVEWTPEGKIYSWDLAFLQTKYKNTFYQVDEEEIAAYFPVEHTIEALLNLYSEFLGLTFVQERTDGFWHETVRVIQVHKHDEHNTLIGTLLVDLFPRQGKYTHACHMSIIPTFINEQGIQHPGLSVVLANFPTARGDAPALLKLGDVRTFFHEFGHALHALLGATTIVSLSGTNTKRDFVELPSQLLEEWLGEPHILKRVSSHYQTGAPLSDDLIARIINLKHFFAGYYVQRQAYLALLALAYYTLPIPVDLDATMQALFHQTISHVVYESDAHFYASFGHLSGYGAKYYGYLWSRVFAQDLFEMIKKEGLTNLEVGKRYVACILQPGGTKDPMEMMVQFLGREPSAEHFFDAMGL